MLVLRICVCVCVYVGAHELSVCSETRTLWFLVTGGNVKENDKEDYDRREDDKKREWGG